MTLNVFPLLLHNYIKLYLVTRARTMPTDYWRKGPPYWDWDKQSSAVRSFAQSSCFAQASPSCSTSPNEGAWNTRIGYFNINTKCWLQFPKNICLNLWNRVKFGANVSTWLSEERPLLPLNTQWGWWGLCYRQGGMRQITPAYTKRSPPGLAPQ